MAGGRGRARAVMRRACRDAMVVAGGRAGRRRHATRLPTRALPAYIPFAAACCAATAWRRPLELYSGENAEGAGGLSGYDMAYGRYSA